MLKLIPLLLIGLQAHASKPTLFNAKYNYFETMPKMGTRVVFKNAKTDCPTGELPSIKVEEWERPLQLQSTDKRKTIAINYKNILVSAKCVSTNNYSAIQMEFSVENKGPRVTHTSMTLLDQIDIVEQEGYALKSPK